MTTLMRNLWRNLVGSGRNEPQLVAATTSERARRAPGPAVEIAPNDPIIAYFQSAPGAVEIDKLTLDRGTIEATIKHKGQVVSGSCPLSKLEKLKPAGK